MGRKSKDELSRERKNKIANDWRRKNTKRYLIAFNIKTYPDVIEKLETVPAKNRYIAGLIREDMRREEEKKEEHLN